MDKEIKITNETLITFLKICYTCFSKEDFCEYVDRVFPIKSMSSVELYNLIKEEVENDKKKDKEIYNKTRDMIEEGRIKK